MLHFLVALLILTVPFTWSYLGIIGGFLVRPFDVIGIILVCYVFLIRRHIKISQALLVYYAVFLSLLAWIFLAGILNMDTSSFVSSIKVLYYITISLAVFNYFVINDYTINARIFVLLTVSGILFFIYFKQDLLSVVTSFSALALENPQRVFVEFWALMFQINLFGPSGLIEVNGVSFRNTAALGFLTIALIIYGFARSSVASIAFTSVCIGILLMLQSRTGIACAAVFLMLIVFSPRNISGLVGAILILAAFSAIMLNDLVLENTLNRFASQDNVRVSMNAEAFDKISSAPFFGQGSESYVAHLSNKRTAHNVPIALGARYGSPALILAIGLIFLNAASFLYFIFRWHTARIGKAKRLYVSFAVAALVLTVRPNVSSTAENIYSLPEWLCFSLVATGYYYAQRSTALTPRADRFARPIEAESDLVHSPPGRAPA